MNFASDNVLCFAVAQHTLGEICGLTTRPLRVYHSRRGAGGSLAVLMSEEGQISQVILVAGPSGAGKTVLVSGLVESMGSCVRVGMDDYYADNRGTPMEKRSAINFDHPDAIDWVLLMEHVESLVAGRPIEKPCYDFATHTRLRRLETILPHAYIVVDGIHAMNNECLVGAACLTVYVDATRETCFMRRVNRDVGERGRSAESVREQFDRTVWPMAETFVLPMRVRADFVVSDGMSIADAVGGIRERLLG